MKLGNISLAEVGNPARSGKIIIGGKSHDGRVKFKKKVSPLDEINSIPRGHVFKLYNDIVEKIVRRQLISLFSNTNAEFRLYKICDLPLMMPQFSEESEANVYEAIPKVE